MNFKYLHDKILVYNGVLDSPKELVKCFNKISESSFQGIVYQDWRDWYTFGRICDCDGNIISDQERYEALRLELPCEQNALFDAEKYLYQELVKATHECINHYMGLFSITAPEPNYITNPGIAVYNSDVDTDLNGHTMNYHTDYAIGEWWWPGEKFLLTCTTYINDDYDGGEIVFFVDDKVIPYKPVAGDIVVFPSGDPKYPGGSPYFHGVRMATNGHKILVRTYLKYFSNSNIFFWESCRKNYGKEKWKEMTQLNARGKNMLWWPDIQEKLNNPNKELYSELIRHLYGT